MKELKCPICQNNLHKINVIVSTCTNDKCKLWGSPIPNLVLEALQQAKQDLERTRKALGVAVDTLERIASEECKYPIGAAAGTIIRIEQITALEQKDK